VTVDRAGAPGEGAPATHGQGAANALLDVAAAAMHLGVTEAFVRRLVLERRVRYYKLGKFVRFRPADLDAFVDAGRREPVPPWVHARSTLRRSGASSTAQEAIARRRSNGTAAPRKRSAGR